MVGVGGLDDCHWLDDGDAVDDDNNRLGDPANRVDGSERLIDELIAIEAKFAHEGTIDGSWIGTVQLRHGCS
ncbi:MAG: hypothetical protein EBQ89_00465 [Alphaproteobacteria bacterium]|nr:hypothetical protein [Alphaproteobacteria bacterium]